MKSLEGVKVRSALPEDWSGESSITLFGVILSSFTQMRIACGHTCHSSSAVIKSE